MFRLLGLVCSIIFLVHPHACCRSERIFDELRSAHVRPGHQDTSYGLHMSGLVTKTQATALMEHSLLHLTFLASRLNGHSESKAFRAEGQTQDFEKSNEQRSTVPRAMFI